MDYNLTNLGSLDFENLTATLFERFLVSATLENEASKSCCVAMTTGNQGVATASYSSDVDTWESESSSSVWDPMADERPPTTGG